MSDSRGHRGPDPRDAEEFASAEWPRLRLAVSELSWLWTRGYAENAALKLVGDRHSLTARQRLAVRRCACPDQARTRRERHRVRTADLMGRSLEIDGFNVLTTLEAALGGAVILVARDGSCRDVAGVHGTYRMVQETEPALKFLGHRLEGFGVGNCRWFLDAPVSNSGRLAALIRDFAEAMGWPWTVEVVTSPDRELKRADNPAVIVTADSAILDQVDAWFPLSRTVVEADVPDAWRIDLS